MFHEHESQSQSNRLKIEHFCFSVCGGNSDTCPQEANLSQKNQQKKKRRWPTVFNPYPSPHRTNPAATNPPLLNSSLSFSPPLRLRRLFLSASSLLLPLPATPHLLLSSRRLEPGALLPRVATGGSASPPLASSPSPWGRGRAHGGRRRRLGIPDPASWMAGSSGSGRGGEVVVAWFPSGGGALFYGFSSFCFSPFLWI